MAFRHVGGLVLVFGLATNSLLAQESPFGRPDSKGPTDWTESPIKPEISGFVRLAQGRGIPGRVLVRLETQTGTLLQQSWTGESGQFSFPQIACGNYVLAVDAPGFRPVRVPVEHSYIPLGTVFLKLVRADAASAGTQAATAPALEAQIPKQARKEYEKGLEALTRKKAQQSIGHFRRAIEIYPEYDAAYLNLAWAYLQQRAYPETQQVLEQILRRNDKIAGAHLLLGIVQKQQNRLPEAVQHFEHTLSLEEASWKTHLELGGVLLRLGRRDLAYAHMLRAHQLNAAQPATHLQLYNTLILRGDYSAALAELEEFLRLFPDHPLIARVRQQRDTLQAKLQRAEVK